MNIVKIPLNSCGALAAICSLAILGTSNGYAQTLDTTPNFYEAAVSLGLQEYKATGTVVHAPGTVFADLNLDGYPDIYAVDVSGNSLYLNVPDANGERTFQLVPAAAGANPGTNSVGASPADYDNDGDIDIFVPRFDRPNVLFKNMLKEEGTLRFVDVTATTDPTRSSNDSAYAECAERGQPCEFTGIQQVIYRSGNTQIAGLFEGGVQCLPSVFGITDAAIDGQCLVTPQSGLAESRDTGGLLLERSFTASWGDVNRDGHLDLYIGTHNGPHGNGALPGGTPGMRDTLYLNQGNGTFLDVTEAFDVTGTEGLRGDFQDGRQRYSSSMATMFVDINNDQWPDLIVINKTGIIQSSLIDYNQLYLNRGNDNRGEWLGFDNVTHSLPGGFFSPNWAMAAMSIVAADVDNDGDLDLTFSDDPALEFQFGGTRGANELVINQLSETGSLGFVVDHTSVSAGFSWGTSFEDFDNNGYVDLFTAGANCCGGSALPDWLYMNNGGQFEQRTLEGNISSNPNSDGRGNATADFNRDGWMDLLQVYNDGSVSELYINEGSQIHVRRKGVSILLIGDPDAPGPFASTRDAIGARVTLVADIDGDGRVEAGSGETQIREVASGYNLGASAGSLEVEFGMGLASTGTLSVKWPSGRETSHSLSAGSHYLLDEVGGLSVRSQAPADTGTADDEITLTVDAEYTLFLNGRQIDSNFLWQDSRSIDASLAPGDVIAIEARDRVDVAGALVELNIAGNRQGSSNAWKVNTTVTGNWTGQGYDDSAWPRATDYGAYGSSPWGRRVNGMPNDTPARWIWTDDNVNDDLAYFRYTIPNEESPVVPYGQSRIISTVDSDYTMHLNGVEIASGNQWQNSARLTPTLAPGDVITISATDRLSFGSALVELNLDGNLIGTSSDWRVTTTRPPAGWQLKGFNDSAWPAATEYGAYGSRPWGNRVVGMPNGTPARWIWTDDHQNDNVVFFRFVIPAL